MENELTKSDKLYILLTIIVFGGLPLLWNNILLKDEFDILGYFQLVAMWYFLLDWAIQLCISIIYGLGIPHGLFAEKIKIPGWINVCLFIPYAFIAFLYTIGSFLYPIIVIAFFLFLGIFFFWVQFISYIGLKIGYGIHEMLRKREPNNENPAN